MGTIAHRSFTVGLGTFLLFHVCAVVVRAADADVPGENQEGVAEVCLDELSFVKINGTSRFVIGMYELPKSDQKLRELAENGFNLVQVPQDAKQLDRVWEHKLYAWIALGRAVELDSNDSEGQRRLGRIINDFRDHPALLVWELPDEVLWHVWWAKYLWVQNEQPAELEKHLEQVKASGSHADLARLRTLLDNAKDYDRRGLWKQAEDIYDQLWKELGLKNPHPEWKMSECPTQADRLTEAIGRGCRVVRQLDPNHIIWQNHACRNSVRRLSQYNQIVDAAGCDIYPASNKGVQQGDLKDTSLSAVGAYTDRMRQAAPGKSIWMVLQGFGWRDLPEVDSSNADSDKNRRPNWEETRFMAYDALIHGANAILYWGTHHIEKNSDLWRDLMRIACQLRALEPALLGQPPERPPIAVADETYASVDEGPRLMLRKADEDWVLIAVNERPEGISFAVKQLPAQMEGKTLERLYSQDRHVVRERSIRDGIRGFGVHVYATNRRFEAR